MNNPDDSPEERSDRSREDHDHRFFFFGWKQVLGAFLLIFVIVQGMLFWFGQQMRSSSNQKVQEARAILREASALPDTTTALTLRVEEMAADLRERSTWILRRANRDSFPHRLNDELRARFLEESPMYRLPADWKSMLSPSLQEWAQTRRENRRNRILEFFSHLRTQLTRTREELMTTQALLEKHAPEGEFGGARRRFREARTRLRTQLDEVLEKLGDVRLTAPKIPRPLFHEILDVPDAMTRVSLHLNRLSGLTSRPSAILHAKKVLQDALRIDPENPRAHYWLGEVYARMNLHVLAAEQFGRALRSDPGFPRRDEILKRLRRRLAENPDSARRHYDLAFALYEVGRTGEARRHLEEVLDLEAGKKSFVKVLAQKRIDYIDHGEPPYHVPVNF